MSQILTNIRYQCNYWVCVHQQQTSQIPLILRTRMRDSFSIHLPEEKVMHRKINKDCKCILLSAFHTLINTSQMHVRRHTQIAVHLNYKKALYLGVCRNSVQWNPSFLKCFTVMWQGLPFTLCG